jgi:hypothetical protein
MMRSCGDALSAGKSGSCMAGQRTSGKKNRAFFKAESYCHRGPCGIIRTVDVTRESGKKSPQFHFERELPLRKGCVKESNPA